MATSYDAGVADMDDAAVWAEDGEAPLGSPKINATTSGPTARAYERFLEIPVWVVLAVMWVAGAALLVSSALALYVVGSLVVGAMA